MHHSRPCGNPKVARSRPHSAPSDAHEPRVCIGNASKNALTAHFVHPTETGATTNQRSKCIIPTHAGTQTLSETDPHFQRHRMPRSPVSAPEMHPNMHRLCTDCAPTVHFVHHTATDKTGNREGNDGVARAGLSKLHKRNDAGAGV